jgi:hypothetical protein
MVDCKAAKAGDFDFLAPLKAVLDYFKDLLCDLAGFFFG